MRICKSVHCTKYEIWSQMCKPRNPANTQLCQGLTPVLRDWSSLVAEGAVVQGVTFASRYRGRPQSTLQVPRSALRPCLRPHAPPLALCWICLVTGRLVLQPRFVRLALADQRTMAPGQEAESRLLIYWRILLETWAQCTFESRTIEARRVGKGNITAEIASCISCRAPHGDGTKMRMMYMCACVLW